MYKCITALFVWGLAFGLVAISPTSLAQTGTGGGDPTTTVVICPLTTAPAPGPGQGTPGGPATPGGPGQGTPGGPNGGGPQPTAACPGPAGTITALPNVCTIDPATGVCASTITWGGSGGNLIRVRVFFHETGVTQAFSSGASGSAVAPWITTAGMRFELVVDGVVVDSVEVVGNLPPTVSLTAPANGASFTTPLNTTLTATAVDADGIAKVEFFDNGVLIGSPDTLAPYSVAWSSTVLGSHTLTARATDTRGTATTSAPAVVTISTVKLTSINKLVDSTVASGSTASATFRLATAGKIRFQTSVGGAYVEQSPFDEWLEPESAIEGANYEVLATPVSGTVSSGAVNQWLGLGSATPRDWVLTRATAGTAQAVVTIQIRRIGTTTVLASTNVTLSATVTTPPNLPPAVALTQPLANSVFTTPANISIVASASDSDGTISKVEFYNGATLLNPTGDTTVPYSIDWGVVVAGSYTLTAKAYDNLGAVTTSAPVPIIVNAPPSVSLAALATQNAPCTWTLSATASDSDGTISQVQFFNGATSLGIDTTAPYNAPLSGVAAGSYSLTAKATDNRGSVTTSLPVTAVCNALPTVSITNPIAGSTQSTFFDLTAAAADSDGSIVSVQYFEGAIAINPTPVTIAPYTFPWSNVALGSHTVTANAIDNRGAVKTSSAVTFTVADVPPTATLTAPANGSSYTRPSGPTLTATASTSTGTISKVEFFDNGVKLGEDLTAPYAYPSDGTTWNTTTVAAGSHALTVRATNSLGTVGPLSAAVTITLIDPSPTVNFTAPAANSSHAERSLVTLSATAAIPLGSISQVEFFDGTTPIGSPDTLAPYSVEWTASGIGSHTLKAKATSSWGTSATASIPVNVTNPPPTVMLTAPSAGATFTPGATITLTANASDANGTISQVEFLSGGVVLPGSTDNPNPDTTAPYAFTWSNVPVGSYTLTAKATDNLGATATTPAITITVAGAAMCFVLPVKPGSVP